MNVRISVWRVWRHFLLLAAVLSFGPHLPAQTPPPSLPLDLPAQFSIEDPRLLQKVTVVSPDITFNDILEDLSRQAQVALKIDEDAPASGVSVLVRFQNRPLIEVLNSLWSVVSYKDCEWAWNRAGKGRQTVYTLVKTKKSSELSAKIERFAWNALRKWWRQNSILPP